MSHYVHHLVVHHLMVRHLMVRHLMVRYIVSIRHFLTLYSVIDSIRHFLTHIVSIRHFLRPRTAAQIVAAWAAKGRVLAAAVALTGGIFLGLFVSEGQPQAVRGAPRQRGRARTGRSRRFCSDRDSIMS